MKHELAKHKVCPFISTITVHNNEEVELHQKCIVENCMAWVTTADGEVEVDRYKIPYETLPYDKGNIHRKMIAKGYKEVSHETYVLYEYKCEGYCELSKKTTKEKK